MAITIPRKIIEATAREAFIVCSRPLHSRSGDNAYTLKFRREYLTLTGPGLHKHINFDPITISVIEEALAKCYIYDAETEPTYRVKVELRRIDTMERMRTVVDCSIWFERLGHRACISIANGDEYPGIRFELNRIESSEEKNYGYRFAAIAI